MKIAVKKLVAVLCCALLITAAVAPCALALDFFNNLTDILGDDFNEMLSDFFNNGNGEGDEAASNPALSLSDLFSNPGGILDVLRQRLAANDIDVSNSAIASALAAILTNENGLDLSALLNSNELVNRLIDYFANDPNATTTTEESTTEEEPTEETTTEETTTATPSTTLPPVTIYIPATQAFTDTTAEESESEPEYSYVEPSVEYTDQLTTVPFSPVYEEDYSEPEEGVSAKMVIGIIILALSAVAVVVVAVVLKKTKV